MIRRKKEIEKAKRREEKREQNGTKINSNTEEDKYGSEEHGDDDFLLGAVERWAQEKDGDEEVLKDEIDAKQTKEILVHLTILVM